jgi:lysyl-tRNA synthetase class II
MDSFDVMWGRLVMFLTDQANIKEVLLFPANSKF